MKQNILQILKVSLSFNISSNETNILVITKSLKSSLYA